MSRMKQILGEGHAGRRGQFCKKALYQPDPGPQVVLVECGHEAETESLAQGSWNSIFGENDVDKGRHPEPRMYASADQ